MEGTQKSELQDPLPLTQSMLGPEVPSQDHQSLQVSLVAFTGCFSPIINLFWG